MYSKSNKDNLFTSDQGTNDRIISECPNALENGRKTNFTLNIDGVDYITQLEQQKFRIPTLNEQYSQGKCEDKKVELKNSFAKSPKDIELIFPLGTVSHRHVIATDHMLVQWTNMQIGRAHV